MPVRTVLTWDGFDINDGINTNAYMPDDSAIKQQPARAIYVPRHLMPPLYSTVQFSEQLRTLVIEFLQDDPDYWNTIKGQFDVMVDAEKELIGVDENGKQWYLMAKVIEQQPFKNTHLIFKLSCGDGAWRSVDENSDLTWTISASGDQHVISPQVGGNVNAYPTFRIIPNTAKSNASSFNYRRLSKVYSQSVNSALVYPFDVTHGGWDSAAVIASTSKSNQINNGAGITDTDVTIPIDTAVGGGLPSSGMAYVGTEQISYTGNTGSSLTGVTRGINGTAAAAHADNAVIYWSRMKADGSDVEVELGGAPVDYWFGTGSNDINQAATKVWINLPKISPAIDLVIDGALGTGAITQLSIAQTKAMRTLFQTLPKSGRGLIDSEVFSWDGIDAKTFTLNNVKRAINGTTAAAHSDGATMHWLEHEIWLMYGNQNAETPTISDAQKPIIDLTSTNTSWVYTIFSDLTNLRAGSWIGRLIDSIARPANILSAIYTATQAAEADPSTDAGMTIASWLYGNAWRAENASLEWRITHPFGVTTVTSSGKKNRTTASWPALAALQYSDDGNKRWTSVWNESAGTLNTWDTWTHNSQSLSGTRRYLRFVFAGKQQASTNGYAAFEVGGVTLTLDSGEVPTGALDAELTNYELNCKITVVETGHFVQVRRNVDPGEYLELNSEISVTTYGKDGTHGPKAERDEKRPHYLELVAGETNTLQFDDTGTTGVDVDIYWRDRMN